MDWLTEHPLWRNVVARTTIYYLIAGAIAALLYRYVPSAWGMLGGETLSDLLAAPVPGAGASIGGPTPLATAIAMTTAFAT